MQSNQAYKNDNMYSQCESCGCRHAGCHGYGPPCRCCPKCDKGVVKEDIRDFIVTKTGKKTENGNNEITISKPLIAAKGTTCPNCDGKGRMGW